MPNAKGMLRIRHERVDGALPYVQQCALVPGLEDYLAVDNAHGFHPLGCVRSKRNRGTGELVLPFAKNPAMLYPVELSE